MTIADLVRAWDTATDTWWPSSASRSERPRRRARLLRYRRAGGLLARGELRPAQAAALCGYADQSHLNQEYVSYGGTTLGLEHLGRAAVTVQRLRELGRAALGDPRAILRSVRFSPVAYPTSTIVTERLTHCQSTFVGGRRVRIFIKEIRDVIHWPMLHVVPEHLRASFLTEFPW